MRIGTLSVIAGTRACNASCPHCVSKMTPEQGITDSLPEINHRNLAKTCVFAKDTGAETVLITGKGEPTLAPSHIIEYLDAFVPFAFPFVELQTNGILLYGSSLDSHLSSWYNRGLTTVSLSVVHRDVILNAAFLNYNRAFNYWAVVKKLHQHGFMVRLSCVLCREFTDSAKEVRKFLETAKNKGIEQTTFRTIRRPDISEDKDVATWVDKHALRAGELDGALRDIVTEGTPLLQLPDGGKIYDLHGQNVCVATCLTSSTDPENQRQLIFYPSGRLYYDWKYEAARLL